MECRSVSKSTAFPYLVDESMIERFSVAGSKSKARAMKGDRAKSISSDYQSRSDRDSRYANIGHSIKYRLSARCIKPERPVLPQQTPKPTNTQRAKRVQRKMFHAAP